MALSLERMNLKLSYLYRDASNYKRHGEIVLAGLPEEGVATFEAALRNALHEGAFFIAGQVGVPEVFHWLHGYARGDDDHCYHEFSGVEATDSAPTDPRTPAVLLAAYQKASREGWVEFDPLAD